MTIYIIKEFRYTDDWDNDIYEPILYFTDIQLANNYILHDTGTFKIESAELLNKQDDYTVKKMKGGLDE